MEDPVSLSDTEDYSLEESSLMQTSQDNQDYLVMTIELGDGQQEHIKIHATDDPALLAHEFIVSHQLSPDLEQSLSNLIKQNIGLLDKRSQPSPFLKSSLSNYNSVTKDPGQFRSFEVPSLLKHTPQINKRSLIITSKQSRGGDIHERLYKLATRRKAKVEKQTKSISEKSAPSFYNPGEILYIKGLAMKHSKKRQTEEILKERDLKESKELTFKPIINPGQSRYDEKPEDILINKAKDYEIHKKVLKEKFVQEELKDCTFQPNPQKLKNKKLGSLDRPVHEQLYQESYTRKEKQNNLASMKLFPFEPNADQPKYESYETKAEFIDRLINSKQKLNEEMEKLRQFQSRQFDENTGQTFFSPVINRNREANLRKQDKNVWEYLYSMKDKKKENIRKLLKEEESYWEKSANLPKVGNQSQKVFEKYRFKQYKKLFEAMDSDKDGVISADFIELNGIPEKQLEILAPLLEHLLNTGGNVDFSTFSQHLEQLRGHLDLHSRAVIIQRDKKVEIPEIDPHPQLTLNTIEIAERNRPDEGMYERQVKEKLVNQLKNEKRKEMREEDVVKSCSFKPTLINSARVGYY
jgi:hypothetical protein